MTMIRVWNITDDPNSAVEPHNRMVLGKVLKPGRALQVDDSRLVGAHKITAEVNAKMLFIGPRPPAAYSQSKSPKRVQPDARLVDGAGRRQGTVSPTVARAHGEAPLEAIADDGVKALGGVKTVEEKPERLPPVPDVKKDRHGKESSKGDKKKSKE